MSSLILVLLIWHWMGDFYLQSRWMAENKSKNSLALLLHVSIYTFILFFGLVWERWNLIGPFILVPIIVAAKFALLNGVLHFCTDYVTSRISSYYRRNENMHAFFTTIGFDQLIHSYCLVVTAECLLKQYLL